MIEGAAWLKPDHVHDKQVSFVMLVEFIEVACIHKTGDAVLTSSKYQPIGLYRVVVPDRRAKRDVGDVIASAFFQDLDVPEIGTQISEDNWVFVQSVSWSEEDSSLTQTSVGHGFDQDIDIGSMVEVSMGENDGPQLGGLQFSLGSLNQGPRTGIEQYFCAAQVEPKPA